MKICEKIQSQDFLISAALQKPAEFQNTQNSSAKISWKSRNFPSKHFPLTNTSNDRTSKTNTNETLMKRVKLLRVFTIFPFYFVYLFLERKQWNEGARIQPRLVRQTYGRNWRKQKVSVTFLSVYSLHLKNSHRKISQSVFKAFFTPFSRLQWRHFVIDFRCCSLKNRSVDTLSSIKSHLINDKFIVGEIRKT